MRVPYAPSTPPTADSEAIYARIAARRSPRPPIPLDLALLHNPAVADGWNSFIGAIRTNTSLDAALRELAIARIAVLNQAVHEWEVHGSLALRAGVSREGLRAVRAQAVFVRGNVLDDGREGGRDGLSREQWAVLSYTDQMTVGIEVDDAVMNTVKGFLSDKELVELTATVAAYNCVSRFLVALDVGECNGRGLKAVEEL